MRRRVERPISSRIFPGTSYDTFCAHPIRHTHPWTARSAKPISVEEPQQSKEKKMISRLARVTIILATAVLTIAVLATAQTKDPFVGTWGLNVAKSKYSPGPVPKSVTATYEVAGQGYKISVKNEPASGPVQQYSYTTNLDGKDAPVTGNNPNADMVAAKRIDAHTLEIVNKKGGKVTTTQRNVVAADGKTRTVTTTGTDAQGQKVNNVTVFEKQ
jgi:hypothetical protein